MQQDSTESKGLAIMNHACLPMSSEDLKLTVHGEMDIAYRGEIQTPSRCGRMDQCVAFGRAVSLIARWRYVAGCPAMKVVNVVLKHPFVSRTPGHSTPCRKYSWLLNTCCADSILFESGFLHVFATLANLTPLIAQVTKMTFDSDLLSTESVRAASNIYMVVVDLCSRKEPDIARCVEGASAGQT